MQVLSTSSDMNMYWLNSKGMWLGYLTTVVILHMVLLSMPFLSTALAWTLTHVIHNLVSVDVRPAAYDRVEHCWDVLRDST